MFLDALKPEDTVKILNEALATDSVAIAALVNTRVNCNTDLQNHPSIQMDKKVGILGIINGMFGTDQDGWGCIAANYKLVCSNNKTHKIPKGFTTKNICRDCEGLIILGDLEDFRIIRRNEAPKIVSNDLPVKNHCTPKKTRGNQNEPK